MSSPSPPESIQMDVKDAQRPPRKSLRRHSDVPVFTEEPGKITKWIKDNFSRKECSYFIPAKENAEQRCGCGRLKVQHERDSAPGKNELWSSKKHSKEFETDAFGLVSFSEAAQDAGIAAEYVRLAENTKPELVWLLLTKLWNLKAPILMLSIIGGNKSTTLDTVVKSSLEEGLAKVMHVADTWLITSATNTHITRVVSTAFHDHYQKGRETRNACIGIAPWGCLRWKEQLLGELAEVIYRPENESRNETRNLCENHTHFLFADDGSINRYGIERKFRSSLESYLSNPNESKVIPCISLLIEGGLSACLQIRENLKNSKQISVVVMKGSGGLAEVLCRAFAKVKEDGANGARLHCLIRDIVKEEMGFDSEEHTNVAVTTFVKEMTERHDNQIVIYDPTEDPYGLHQAIMEASKASYSGESELKEKLSRLQLAIHLDEMEIARRDIQNEAADVEYINTALYKSIKRGKATFVEFLLKFGVDLKEFIKDDKEVLRKLYKKQLDGQHFFSVLLSKEDKKKAKTNGTFDLEIIDNLLDRYMEEDYTKLYTERRFYDYDKRNSGIAPIQELIVWAVFADVIEMVECFWRHDTKRALENAIVIFRLYRAMSKKLKNIDEIKRDQLRSHSRKYEERATALLSLSYCENAQSAMDVVTTPIPLWGNKNLISLAANGKARDFVAQTCCQNYLNLLWHGKRDENTVTSRVAVRKSGIAREKKKEKHGTPNKKRYSSEALEESNYLHILLAPKGKLLMNAFMYLVFLGCFSYELLVKKEKQSNSLWYIIHFFVAALTIDQIREILEENKKTIYSKYKQWVWSMWNILEFYAVLLFYIGFGLSFKHKNASKIVFATDLVIWIIKYAQFYRTLKSVGPYLTMIYRMLFHMAAFVLVLMTVVLAFGIFNYVLLYPDEKISFDVFFRLLFRPYLLVFGELGLQAYSLSSNSTVFGTKKLDRSIEIVAVLGMCIYLLIANVLLLNLLIAAFNNIYEDVKDNTVKIWRFDRYHLITEYMRKSRLPVPFSALSSLLRFFRWILQFCGACKRHSLTSHPGKDKLLEIEEFQHRCMKDFLRAESQPAADFTPNTLKAIKDRVDGNSKALMELDEKIEEKMERLEKLIKRVAGKVDERHKP